MNDDFSYIIPNGNVATFADQARILVDCGQGRKFSQKTYQQYKVTCKNGDFETNQGIVIDVAKLVCTANSKQDGLLKVKKMNKVCGNDGKFYQVGFNVQNGNSQKFRSLYESCFDEQAKSVFYVKSKVYGQMKRDGEQLLINFFKN